jgi:hypothetical protein
MFHKRSVVETRGVATGESTWMHRRMVSGFLEECQPRGTWKFSGSPALFRRPRQRFAYMLPFHGRNVTTSAGSQCLAQWRPPIESSRLRPRSERNSTHRMATFTPLVLPSLTGRASDSERLSLLKSGLALQRPRCATLLKKSPANHPGKGLPSLSNRLQFHVIA